jgi:hypothetical protein
MQSLLLLEMQMQMQRPVTRAMKHYHEKKKMVRNEQNEMNAGMNELTLLLQQVKGEMI